MPRTHAETSSPVLSINSRCAQQRAEHTLIVPSLMNPRKTLHQDGRGDLGNGPERTDQYTNVPDRKALMATGPWVLSSGVCDAICARPLPARPSTNKAIKESTISLTAAVIFLEKLQEIIGTSKPNQPNNCTNCGDRQ